MLYRKIENKIREHLESGSDRILIINGARQTGKSYIIRHVGSALFANYIEINMEEDKLGEQLFKEVRTVHDFYLALSAYAGDKMKEKHNTLVFIDEIQAYPQLLTLLKFLREDDKFTYIASGSQLGIALHMTPSVPIGSIRLLNMYPLDFEEFLIANGLGDMAIEAMRQAYVSQEALPEALHSKILDLFKKYLLTGGLPEAVVEFTEHFNISNVRKIQQDIHTLYGVDASRYEQEQNRRLKIRRIYDMVPSNMENLKKRIVATRIEDKKGKRMNDYQDEFDYLISSGITLDVKAVSKPSFPLLQNSGKNLIKLYLNDVGILTGLFYRNNIKAIMEDLNSINLGSVYETAIAQELKAHGFQLFYYDNKKNGEVDFLIEDTENLSVIPLEIKSGKDYTTHRALDRFLSIEEYNVKKAIVFSNERNVCTQGSILYLPIYYAMFLSPDSQS